MENTTPGSAAVNSAPAENTPPQAPAPDTLPAKQEPAPVPYVRFAELNQQRKAAEDALQAVVDSMIQDLPESMRDLVPPLPPAETAVWLRNAKAKGLFTPPAPVSSPDTKRPGGKMVQDLNTMSPLQMMQAGYGQQ